MTHEQRALLRHHPRPARRRAGHDGQDAQTGTATADEIMAKAERFRRVNIDDRGNLHISLGGNYFFDAYASAESARSVLTSQAFEKYFGTKAAA